MLTLSLEGTGRCLGAFIRQRIFFDTTIREHYNLNRSCLAIRISIWRSLMKKIVVLLMFCLVSVFLNNESFGQGVFATMTSVGYVNNVVTEYFEDGDSIHVNWNVTVNNTNSFGTSVGHEMFIENWDFSSKVVNPSPGSQYCPPGWSSYALATSPYTVPNGSGTEYYATCILEHAIVGNPIQIASEGTDFTYDY